MAYRIFGQALINRHPNKKIIGEVYKYNIKQSTCKRKYRTPHKRNKKTDSIAKEYNITEYWELFESTFEFNYTKDYQLEVKNEEIQKMYLIIAKNYENSDTIELDNKEYIYLNKLKEKTRFMIDEFSEFYNNQDEHFSFVGRLIENGVLN